LRNCFAAPIDGRQVHQRNRGNWRCREIPRRCNRAQSFFSERRGRAPAGRRVITQRVKERWRSWTSADRSIIAARGVTYSLEERGIYDMWRALPAMRGAFSVVTAATASGEICKVPVMCGGTLGEPTLDQLLRESRRLTLRLCFDRTA